MYDSIVWNPNVLSVRNLPYTRVGESLQIKHFWEYANAKMEKGDSAAAWLTGYPPLDA